MIKQGMKNNEWYVHNWYVHNNWYVPNYEEMLVDMKQRKSREQRLARSQEELHELYRKVDRKLDQIKRLREARGIFTLKEREKR